MRTRLAAAVVIVLGFLSVLIVGPAGATPSQIPGWEVFCFYSHTLPDDPIVDPGQPGASHVHQFFGNTGTDASSTPATLRTGSTNCQLSADRAGYWSPALYSSGVEQVPTRLHAYYRWGNVTDFAHIVPLAYDTKMIGGDHAATGPQPTSVIGWSCGAQGESLANAPKDCRGTGHGQGGSSEEVVHVFFANCQRTGSLPGDPTNYIYSHNGACASEYTAVPRLSFDVAWTAKAPSTYTLAGKNASGINIKTASVYTFHADLMNGWTTSVMNQLTHDCINAGRQCGPLKDGDPLP